MKATTRTASTPSASNSDSPKHPVMVAEDGDLLRSQLAIEIGAAREIAAEWRQAVIAKGFSELPREAPDAE